MLDEARWRNSDREVCSRLHKLSNKRGGEDAEKAAVESPASAVEMGWTCVDDTGGQQRAWDTNMTKNPAAHTGEQGEVRQHRPTPLLIKLEGLHHVGVQPGTSGEMGDGSPGGEESNVSVHFYPLHTSTCS